MPALQRAFLRPLLLDASHSASACTMPLPGDVSACASACTVPLTMHVPVFAALLCMQPRLKRQRPLARARPQLLHLRLLSVDASYCSLPAQLLLRCLCLHCAPHSACVCRIPLHAAPPEAPAALGSRLPPAAAGPRCVAVRPEATHHAGPCSWHYARTADASAAAVAAAAATVSG
jgi:hypothetical protein